MMLLVPSTLTTVSLFFSLSDLPTCSIRHPPFTIHRHQDTRTFNRYLLDVRINSRYPGVFHITCFFTILPVPEVILRVSRRPFTTRIARMAGPLRALEVSFHANFVLFTGG